MSKQYFNSLTRSIAVLGLVAGGNSFGLSAVLAAPTAPNVVIENQATGTFTDEADTVEEKIVSNVVSVTVAEVAGITVTAATPSEAPSTVTGAGSLQGDGSINAGDIAYFDFVITNVGNDPTQFFIPGSPTITGSATFDAATNPIEIVSYNPTGTADIPVTSVVTVAVGGQVTGPSTATGTDGLLGKNGIIPAGGSVKIRVPVKVNAAAVFGNNISVQMGKTPSDAQNQVYSANTNGTIGLDIYTQDNPDGTKNALGAVVETADLPLNGDSTNHRQEASATSSTSVIAESISINGTVFEDVNYGGGAGRSLTDATGVGRKDARVEIYDTAGNYLAATLTDANGRYKFNVLNATSAFTESKNYYIRVVNNTVTSSRPGAVPTLLPVQTFRTDVSTGNVTAVTDRVGGENPAVADLGSAKRGDKLNTTNFTFTNFGDSAGEQAESVTKVTLGTTTAANVDFGYNFDTIVNTNDAGQGSLRQFITNANALGGEASLAQLGNRKNARNVNQPLPSGKETSIFMIPDGTAHPGLSAGLTNQLTSGFARIVLESALPTITGSNADNTYLDATTQTVNIGDTNAGQLGTGGNVGVGVDGVFGTADDKTLAKVYAPEVEIIGNNTIAYGLTVESSGDVFRGFALYGNGIGYNTSGSDLNWSGNSGLIEQSVIGTTANSFTDPGTGVRSAGNHIRLTETLAGMKIQNNLIAFAGQRGILVENSDTLTIANNEIRSNNRGDSTTGFNGGGIELLSFYSGSANKNVSIDGNLITGHGSDLGIEIQYGANDANIKIEHNTISNNTIGIYLSQSNNNNPNFVRYNSIYDNTYQGIGIAANGGQAKTISKNSLYNNGALGIDLTTSAGPGVSPNDGSTPGGANKGMDYPIITSSSISGGTLTIKGYVGTPATSSTFAGATLEFFVGAADTNDKGKVFATDAATVSKLHAEGQTYLGTCNAGSDGKFNCSITVPTGTDPKNITSTATDTAGNTSEFNSSSISNPNVLLVKRITAINGNTNTTSGDNLSSYIQENSNPYDDNFIESTFTPSSSFPTPETTYWPNTTGKTSSTFLLGGINGGNIKPKDIIEYTIYFLSTGDSPAENVMFCDRVPSNTTFVPTAFNTYLTQSSGSANDSRGILALINGTTAAYTNVGDGDAARYIPAGTIPKDANNKEIYCGGSNDNGAVVFNLGNIPNATAPGTFGSYGFVRFQGKVK